MRAAIVCFSLLALPLVSHAIDAGPASAEQQETEGWLQLQARNKVPSPTLQTVTPTERELAMQRWLKSYQHDIPEFYDQQQGGKVDSGSGAGHLRPGVVDRQRAGLTGDVVPCGSRPASEGTWSNSQGLPYN